MQSPRVVVPAAAAPPAVATASTSPERRHASTMARAAAAADDRDAQAALLLEVSGQLLAAERLIAQQTQSVRIAQRGRDTTKADMVATNSKLLKVAPPIPPQKSVLRVLANPQAMSPALLPCPHSQGDAVALALARLWLGVGSWQKGMRSPIRLALSQWHAGVLHGAPGTRQRRAVRADAC